tara:strand:+ start:256 stop:573 length:318 start_codon:yes stop_codon:yes gene_type:complete
MSLDHFSKAELHVKLMNLQDRVADHLKKEPDVDIFLDQTNLFDDWEKVLPEAEYPIFVITVLNNIRREAVIASIIDSIGKHGLQSEPEKEGSSVTDKDGIDHPFC